MIIMCWNTRNKNFNSPGKAVGLKIKHGNQAWSAIQLKPLKLGVRERAAIFGFNRSSVSVSYHSATE